MGLLDRVLGKKEEPKVGDSKKISLPVEGKYDNECSLCGEKGTEKKWAGQYWHKKCLRKGKKMAKGMI